MPHEELAKLYNRASVLIRLSDFEGFGYPPLEALFCGTPAVVSDIAVFRETLVEAGVFVKKDERSILDGIEYALENRV
ncbi:glycosyltransferase [Thermogymnomonas acidicola]|uniref:glycosyltransferase n=1 Tax=Thermogymnomonas acidicola TaxID=399579 RepID=UPI0027D2C135|nr:glycosyltransferase [Thermogymnomonas acidicola]